MSQTPTNKALKNTQNPQDRLAQLAGQMGSISNTTSFTQDVVPQAPEDPLFGLMAAYRRDTDSKKVDLGIGAYRDDNAKPWVLPVVKQVRIVIRKGRSDCLTLTCITGRRASTKRSRPQPRIPPHCRSSRLHFRLTEAHPRQEVARHPGQARSLITDHLRNWCCPLGSTLPLQILQPSHTRGKGSIRQRSNLVSHGLFIGTPGK